MNTIAHTQTCAACNGTTKDLITGRFCFQCIGTGKVATNEPGICRQCGLRPFWELRSNKPTSNLPPRVCFECGILNLAKNAESDLGENPTMKEVSDGEQIGAWFRSMLPDSMREVEP
jgi:RecJ-like exonuclease